jgi:hypothetical protein
MIEMKTLKFKNPPDSKKKLMTILFWTYRKTTRTEGCAPLFLKKVVTNGKTYTPKGKKLLKLTDEIVTEIIEDVNGSNPVKFEISMGDEFIKVKLKGNVFSVSTVKSREIEDEIIEKLDFELQKKYPSVCDSFKPRVTHRS